MDVVIVFTVVMAIIILVLLSINQKLSLIIKDNEKPKGDAESIVEIKDLLADIKSALEDIKHTTDIIENYKLPSYDERKSIDQYRADQEIDEMISQKRV